MTGRLRADRRGFRLWLPDDLQPTVDVFLDDHRVWSTKLPPAGRRHGSRRVPWPRALAVRLAGTTRLSVRDSATHEVLGEAEVRFGMPGRGGRLEITDAHGRWLAIDKWNRLGPSFEGNDTGVQGRLLASAVDIARLMTEWGHPIYIVGGSLLGALRSGGLMAHDDDIDFAFWCDRSDPQDVTLVSFEVERRLTAAGHTVVRHGHAHLELVFFAPDGRIDYYIDIFTGYHSDDGLYNQPFALRGELPLVDLLPISTVEVDGVPLPAPARPEAWLEFAYGPDWRVPDPSFRWTTPRSTLRLFENSFGVFNRQRVFWEKTWQAVDERAPSVDPDEFDDTDRFLRLLPPNSFVVDLGCGDGRHAERIAAAGHEVLGVDYSHEALRVARQTAPDGVTYRFLNLNDRHGLITWALETVTSGRRPYFFAHDLLHCMPPLGRADLFTTLKGVLNEQTFLFATFAVDRVPFAAADPLTWALPLKTLRAEAWRWELGVDVLADRLHPTPRGERRSVTALIWV